MTFWPLSIQYPQISVLDMLISFGQQPRKLTPLGGIPPLDSTKRPHITAEQHARDFAFGRPRPQTVDSPQHLDKAMPVKRRELLMMHHVPHWFALQQPISTPNAVQTDLDIGIKRDDERCSDKLLAMRQPKIQRAILA